MARFVASRNRTIRAVSDGAIKSDKGWKVHELEPPLSSMPPQDIFQRLSVRGGKIIDRTKPVDSSQLKVAFVGIWAEHCGIATYSQALFPEIQSRIGSWKLFCEDVPGLPQDPNIVPCWGRGASLVTLADKIKEFDPDIVFIQHEYGIWPNASHWLALMTQLQSYRVIVTMHSVYRHKDKTIVEAATPEIIVHHDLARSVLEEKSITSKVHVIPHGCFPCTNPERYWNLYRSKHTFMQFGFGFRYKSWETSIQAAALLKQKYGDVFFTGLFSESPHSLMEHHVYAEELYDLIDTLGVRENVSLIRGYQTDEVLQSFLRTNQVAVFPYAQDEKHLAFGCSGAARLAMSTGIPVVGSPMPHFYDLQGVVPIAASAEELAKILDRLFSQKGERELLVKRQKDFLEKTSWANVAEAHLAIFCASR